MLNKISFKNYKAFESASIELKPITILLGTNSSGKSSILQSILMFEQTLNNEDKYESALRLNGKYVGLGEIGNIFRNNNLKGKLEFSFEINPTTGGMPLPLNLKRLQKNIRDSIARIYYDLSRIEESKNGETRRKLRYAISGADDEQTAFTIKEIKKMQKNFKSNQQTDIFSDPELTPSNLQFSNRLVELDINSYKKSDELIVALLNNSNSAPFAISYEFRYSTKENNIKITKYTISQQGKTILAFKIQTNKGHKKYLLESDVYSSSYLNDHRVKFGKFSAFENLSLTSNDEGDADPLMRKPSDYDFFSSTVIKIFARYHSYLERAFDSERINYVSPLRAFPKRYYFLDRSKILSSLDSIDGDNLTEILKKEKSVKSRVNQWLEKFGLAVSVEDLKEVIHRLKINQNGLSLDITDVGFGISQVLPIIVQGFMSQKNSMTIIEQPEIHLHPMMQAELADLFIDVIDSDESGSKTLLIETHSESILKRLRRRIAEGKLSHHDVSIYYIHSSKGKNTTAIAEKLAISETGVFEWPLEFYSTDYEDTAEFLKLQK